MPKPVKLVDPVSGKAIPFIPTTDEMPPPATLPPGVTSGRPPLPVGKTVVAPNPARLTEQERKDLTKIGWQEGQTIPPDMAKRLAHMEQAARQDADAPTQPPVDPTTPPVNFQVKDISELPPEQQDATLVAMEEVLQGKKPSASKVSDKIARSKHLDINIGQPERPATQAVPDPNYRPTAAGNPKARPAAAMTEAASEIRTEDPVAPRTHCQHCGYDLALPDIPEPNQPEKLGYLQTMVLGNKPFIKEYPLFGGMVTAIFRTLTIQEIDACFRQVQIEEARGEVVSQMDRYEKINRYRLYLQLQRLRSDRFDHDQPDGLSVASNPNAEAHWETDNDEPLRQIEAYMLKTVLQSESICRVVQQTCNRFNRLVGRLEALSDNTDFWKATGTPS